MRPGGGKAKGASFEREICRKLSLWVTGGRREDCFWRSAMSGGRATVARKRGKDVQQSGDITAVHPEGHAFLDRWYVECKHYKDLSLDAFLVKGTGPLASFWKKACDEAKHYKRSPMLICKQNGWPILVIVEPPYGGCWCPITTPTVKVLLFDEMVSHCPGL